MSYKVKDFSMLEILDALDAAQISVNADGVYIDAAGESHNLTVFDNNYFHHNILVNYRSRKCSLWTPDNPEVAFISLFNSWWNSRKELYLKQAYAYTLKYNPIENYSSREQMTNDTTTHQRATTDTRAHITTRLPAPRRRLRTQPRILRLPPPTRLMGTQWLLTPEGSTRTAKKPLTVQPLKRWKWTRQAARNLLSLHTRATRQPRTFTPGWIP